MKKRVYSKEKWENVNKDNKELLRDFLIELRSNKKSVHTIDQYFQDLRMIFCHIYEDMENKSILEFNKKDFRRIKMWFIEERNVSPARVNRVMSAMHSMMDHAEDEDDFDYEFNVSKRVKGLTREKVREIVFLSDDEIEELREKLKQEKKYKLMCFLDMLYDCAGRRRELLQVNKENLLERNYTNPVRGKGGKVFPLIFFSRTKESLNLYLDQRGEDNIPELWVVGEGENKRAAKYAALYEWILQIRKILNKINGKELALNVHSLRHCSIHNMKKGTHYICKELNKKEGFKLEELKVYAHHNDVGTTEGYLKDESNEVLQDMFGIKLE